MSGILDSILMRVTVTESRVNKILPLCGSFLAKTSFTIRHIASLIGTHVSTFPGVELSPLHYRRLEQDKDSPLGHSGRFWSSYVSFIGKYRGFELVSLLSAYMIHYHGIPYVTLASDASSLRVLGATCKTACTHGL